MFIKASESYRLEIHDPYGDVEWLQHMHKGLLIYYTIKEELEEFVRQEIPAGVQSRIIAHTF